MIASPRKGLSHDLSRVSRKAKLEGKRRHEAADWLKSVVGPIGIPNEPSERDFISCLRNGIILCNVINKIRPGTISKVVANHAPVESESNIWESRPLPAYQYFENVRNFLVAVKDLKLPAFEASDIERENLDLGSVARIVDCVLALKSYHEWKENGGSGVYKHVIVKSPLVLHSASENISRPSFTEAAQPCKQIEKLSADNKMSLSESIVKALSKNIADSKENLNDNQDPVQNLSEILMLCLEEKLRDKHTPLNLQETSLKACASQPQPTSILQENLSFNSNSKSSRVQSRKNNSDYLRILQTQDIDVKDIKALWSETKTEFEDLQNQLMNDLNHLGNLVKEMSERARGYDKVIQENRKLYNMVQDLKGNVRVYCRIRPMLNEESNNVVRFQGQDGTIVVSDPSKDVDDGTKEYQFSRVYGPMVTQDELFKDAQPLIRSVMDGFNVCIFTYGQSRSGKSYTMYSEKETGISFLALNDLFQTVAMRKYLVTYDLSVQMVEICNEKVRDLLAEVSARQDDSSLPTVTSHAVKSITDAINLVKQRELRRTGENSSETFGHSVLTILVQGKDLSGKILRSHLHLVDLAGSGDDDKSLSCLEDVITSLSQKKPYTRYADSKLTSLLQGALGGKAKILVFAHVIPDADRFTKTVSTLEFAQRISAIEVGAAQSNKKNSEVKELQIEIERLKGELGDNIGCSTQARVIPQRVSVKSRRLSLENQTKSTMAPPPTNRRIRRLSLETPKVSAPISLSGPTFIDCALKFPSKRPITPELLNQTPATAKSSTGKGSQIKKSFQTIGKLINGSDKRNQNKLDTTSAKIKDTADSSGKKLDRRLSLTNVPPPKTTRRSSLGGVSTESEKRWL